MLSTLLVVGMISHLWCAAHLVCTAHYSFYSMILANFSDIVLLHYTNITQGFCQGFPLMGSLIFFYHPLLLNYFLASPYIILSLTLSVAIPRLSSILTHDPPRATDLFWFGVVLTLFSPWLAIQIILEVLGFLMSILSVTNMDVVCNR